MKNQWYSFDMDVTEKTSRPVKIFDSTYNLINKNKGNRTVSLYIDDAVRYYAKAMDNGDDITQIKKSIEVINDRQATNLGLLCEVLRQAKILNGNGEINFTQG